MYNKEALRKLLEDCWDTAIRRAIYEYKPAILGSRNPPPKNKEDFITSQLSVMSEDDGQEGKGLHIWDAIDGSFAEVDTFEDARKWVRENYSDPEEGFHPDIESIEIFKKVGQVILEQVEGKDTYWVKIEHIPALPVADGEGEKVGAMIEYLDELPISSGEGFNMLKAIKQKLHETTLPSAVTGEVKWVNVKDGLPENDNNVFVYMAKFGDLNNAQSEYIGGWTGKFWNLAQDHPGKDAENNADYWTVTHWMPLPPSPGQPEQGKDEK